MDELVFLGCYTDVSGGTGEGISLARRDPASGALTGLAVVARTPSPSFLAQHPTRPVLYAVNELDEGTVSAFGVADDGSLTPLAVQPTGGKDPCHVAVASDGSHLLVANYSSGSVAVFPLDADGVPGPRCDLLELAGSGPVADRQQGPHAHMVNPDPNGPDVLVCDLGSDRVWRTRLDPVSGRLALVGAAITAEPGTGPRHLLRSAGGALLLVGELTGELSWHRPGEQPGKVVTSEGRPNQPSEITAGRDGRFVYVGNRGPNTVSVFAWDGERGTLVAEVSTGGDWPRHLALAGDHLYVANERSHNVTIFRINPDSGIPAAIAGSVGLGSPTCIARFHAPIG
ncbi:lactonase family protein [Actinoplanes sp. TFC3]|uniref:lactonase family protein n=1 Tax=Actinoplanes sp. TFC3 TaxID=1710355 RepID=UPI00083780DA|nr:lactonase family protein [Actinoplanes sp. TFC3]